MPKCARIACADGLHQVLGGCDVRAAGKFWSLPAGTRALTLCIRSWADAMCLLPDAMCSLPAESGRCRVEWVSCRENLDVGAAHAVPAGRDASPDQLHQDAAAVNQVAVKRDAYAALRF